MSGEVAERLPKSFDDGSTTFRYSLQTGRLDMHTSNVHELAKRGTSRIRIRF